MNYPRGRELGSPSRATRLRATQTRSCAGNVMLWQYQSKWKQIDYLHFMNLHLSDYVHFTKHMFYVSTCIILSGITQMATCEEKSGGKHSNTEKMAKFTFLFLSFSSLLFFLFLFASYLFCYAGTNLKLDKRPFDTSKKKKTIYQCARVRETQLLLFHLCNISTHEWHSVKLWNGPQSLVYKERIQLS